MLADPSKPAKQTVRDVRAVAQTMFGIELDHRIVSVAQLEHERRRTRRSASSSPAAKSGSRIGSINVEAVGLARAGARRARRRATASTPATPRARSRASARPQLVAAAALDAVRQAEPAAEAIHITSAEISRIGSNRVAVVTVVYVDPPTELVVSGSAVVRRDRDDAVARALLDATNRRLARTERGRASRLIRRRATIRASLGPCPRSPSKLSYRLGGADGVAVEARKWEWALHELGFDVRRVAGELDDGAASRRHLAAVPRHRSGRRERARIPTRSRPRSPAPTSSSSRTCARSRSTPTLRRLDRCGARRARRPRACSTTTTCRGNAPGLATPPASRRTATNSLHVTINDHSRVQLENRGFAAVTLRNAFDLDPPRGDRDGDTRARSASRPTTSCSCSRPARSRGRTSRRRSRSRPSSRVASPTASSGSGSPARRRTATTTCSLGCVADAPVPDHRRSRRDRRPTRTRPPTSSSSRRPGKDSATR